MELTGQEDSWQKGAGRMGTEPKVSVICVDCSKECIERFLMTNNYGNIEIIRTVVNESFIENLISFSQHTDSKYICFLEEGQTFDSNKIQYMVDVLQGLEDSVNALICERFYADQNGFIFGCTYRDYRGKVDGALVEGKEFLEICLEDERNLYGSLSTLLFRTRDFAMQMQIIPKEIINPQNGKIALLYNTMLQMSMFIKEAELVISTVRKLDLEEVRMYQKAFYDIVKYLTKNQWLHVEIKKYKGLPAEYIYLLEKGEEKRKLEKDMTFFYTDQGEYFNVLPIAEEAKRRGFSVHFTENLREKANIGVYCQHEKYPENAKFSIALFHDLVEGCRNWPDTWSAEYWNAMDVGILPGETWGERWKAAACQIYANPRQGVYTLGYPKGDWTQSKDFWKKTEELRKGLSFKWEKTILYAPCYENGIKEDELVQMFKDKEVNLLIKQAAWPESHEATESINKAIEKMRNEHEGKYENVYYMNPKDNIMHALAISDLVISDESSVMTEALIFGVPSIGVKDWADTELAYDYVYRISKNNLEKYAQEILEGTRKDIDIEYWKGKIFKPFGSCSKEIMNLVEYFTQDGEKEHFKKERLIPYYMPICLWS